MNKRIFLSALLIILALCLNVNILAQDQTDDTEIATDTSAALEEGFEPHAEIDTTAIAAQTEPPSPPTFWDFMTSGKYIAFMILMAVGLIILFTKWINYWIRLGAIAVIFVLFGLDYFFPLHPSPMCGVTKLFMFKITMGKYFPAFLAMFAAIMIPSLIGRKLFCGWVCPLGAFQELINKIPHKFKIKNFNFTTFNTVRISLLVMFFLTFFYVRDLFIGLGQAIEVNPFVGVWTSYSAHSIYEPINFFELLHWSVDTTFVVLMTILVISSFVLYRPFCYLICPIGALTWFLEKISLGKIKIDFNACNECGSCEEESPCPTIKPMVENKSKALPDCTSCGECIKTCPEDAIQFKFLK